MGQMPKVILLGLENYGSARLPKELQRAGIQVALVCRPQSFLAKTRFYDERFLLGPRNHGPGLICALGKVVSAWRPDWLQPMDDRAALFCARVAAWGRGQQSGNPLI